MGLHLESSLPLDSGDTFVFAPSYSRFDEFRQDVARFYEVRPYGRPWFRRGAPLPAGGETFWYHSDTEGVWTAHECRLVAELVAPYVESQPHSRSRELAEALVSACFQIAERGGYLRFS